MTLTLARDLPVFLFLSAVALVSYVLFGYPLLLAWISSRSAKPILRRFEPRTVTVLLPVHNGAAWLGAKIESLLALDYPQELVNIIVLLDGPDDDTKSIAEEYRARGIRTVSLPRGGKAAALNAGLELATGEILFFTDVRQPLERSCLRNLVACFADPTVGVVSGELVILEGNTEEQANVGLYWRYEKWIRKCLSAFDSVLGATGAVYAMRRELATPMPSDTLLDDVYLPLGAFFRGYRVILEDSAIAYDYPVSLDREFMRKVRTLAGVYQTISFYPALLGPRNRMWLHFVSHKLGRLLLPFALLVIAISTSFLPSPLRGLAVAAQILIYGFAALDLAAPEQSTLKRLTSPARTFVVLMAAALASIAIVFVPARRLWKS